MLTKLASITFAAFALMLTLQVTTVSGSPIAIPGRSFIRSHLRSLAYAMSFFEELEQSKYLKLLLLYDHQLN
jgi:hypothetical protein